MDSRKNVDSQKNAVDSQENLSGQSRKQQWTEKKPEVDSQEKSCGGSLKDSVGMINAAVAWIMQTAFENQSLNQTVVVMLHARSFPYQ